jgi:hypothetical protein
MQQRAKKFGQFPRLAAAGKISKKRSKLLNDVKDFH